MMVKSEPMPNTALEPTARWPFSMTNSRHVYEVRPCKDKRGFDLISDRLPFGGLRYFTALRGLMSLLVYALPLPLCCYKLGMARPASVAACAIELSADRFNHRKYAGAMNLGAILRRENSRTP